MSLTEEFTAVFQDLHNLKTKITQIQHKIKKAENMVKKEMNHL